MKLRYRLCCLVIGLGVTAGGPARGARVELTHEIEASERTYVVSKALQDTVWIADWTFDPSCTAPNWVKIDGRIRNDGSNYWTVHNAYDGQGYIGGNAAVLAKHDLCWSIPDGYGNDWDYSIRLTYTGPATLSFDYLLDSEAGADRLTVEFDPGCASAGAGGTGDPADVRQELFADGGANSTGQVIDLALPDPGAHCVYIRFSSDASASSEDGLYPQSLPLGAAAVVDNILLVGSPTLINETFSGVLDPNLALVNSGRSVPFGEWARVFSHITDNDKCEENTTCAWLFTDPTAIAASPRMAFGPAATVVRNGLDDIIVSPWVSLVSTPTASGRGLSFRMFPGNRYSTSRIVGNWSVRTLKRVSNTDTSTLGDSIECVGPWMRTTAWNSLGNFKWSTGIVDLSSYVGPEARQMQVRFRVGDGQRLLGAGTPALLETGPGPFIDRVRLFARVLSGPVISAGIDTRSQAQDGFSTQLSGVTPGEHYIPAGGADRIAKSCAFTAGGDLGVNASSPDVITDDYVSVRAVDARQGEPLLSVDVYAAIVEGPHAGKIPPGAVAVGGSEFFEVSAEHPLVNGVPIADSYQMDLPDNYFRGGDRLVYFWRAVDINLGLSSLPAGITGAIPATWAEAENAAGGLYEVSFLPKLDWPATYIAAVQADPEGDVDPTPAEMAAASQVNSILYVQNIVGSRRSGVINRTRFMWAMAHAGYDFDTYDMQGSGNTNNSLASRATVEHVQGYDLIVHDAGRRRDGALSDGSDSDSEKVDQAAFYRDYLANAAGGDPMQGAALWLMGENLVEENAGNALLTTDCGVALVNPGTTGIQPTVEGTTSFTFEPSGQFKDFTGDLFTLDGACPGLGEYDIITATGLDAVQTHRYKLGPMSLGGAVVMNRNIVGDYSTIVSSFPWYDVNFSLPPKPGLGDEPPHTANNGHELVEKVLAGVVGPPSLPTDLDERVLPRRTQLLQNQPNPFNPTTRIDFDLAHAGPVRLDVVDVSGRRVRRLVDGDLSRQRHSVTWNGLDDAGRRVASGVYLYRLETDDLTTARRMILLK